MAFFEVPKRVDVSMSGPFTDIMARLYADLDVIPPPSLLDGYPLGMKDLVDCVYTAHGKLCFVKPSSILIKEDLKIEVGQESSRKVVVGFSGGKDSLATALMCKKEYEQVILFHVPGINRSYPGETKLVPECAEALECELVQQSAVWREKSDYMENPVKDQLILAMMADWGLPRGIFNYSLGVENSNEISKSNILCNWSDSKEMFSAWVSFVHWCGLDKYRYFSLIEHHSQSIKVIWEENPSLLEFTTSCLTPHRFQKMRREQTEDKYHVNLLEHRCGVCWKCCAEYLNLAALEGRIRNTDYLRRAFQKFKQDLPTAFGPGFLQGASDLEILDSAVNPKFINHDSLHSVLFPPEDSGY